MTALETYVAQALHQAVGISGLDLKLAARAVVAALNTRPDADPILRERARCILTVLQSKFRVVGPTVDGVHTGVFDMEMLRRLRSGDSRAEPELQLELTNLISTLGVLTDVQVSTTAVCQPVQLDPTEGQPDGHT